MTDGSFWIVVEILWSILCFGGRGIDALIINERSLLAINYSVKTPAYSNERYSRVNGGLIASKNLHMKLDGYSKESRHHAHSLGDSAGPLHERGRVTPKQFRIADRWY